LLIEAEGEQPLVLEVQGLREGDERSEDILKQSFANDMETSLLAPQLGEVALASANESGEDRRRRRRSAPEVTVNDARVHVAEGIGLDLVESCEEAAQAIGDFSPVGIE